MVATVQMRIIGVVVMYRDWENRVWRFFELDRLIESRWNGVVVRIETLECGGSWRVVVRVEMIWGGCVIAPRGLKASIVR